MFKGDVDEEPHFGSMPQEGSMSRLKHPRRPTELDRCRYCPFRNLQKPL